MQFDQTFEQHFPTHVLVRQHRGIEALTASLVAVIEGARENEDNAALSTENTTQGGFQTSGGQDSWGATTHPSGRLKTKSYGLRSKPILSRCSTAIRY